MSELHTDAAVHYFDTVLHRIACGVRGSDRRSTKHARAVTCPSCVALLRDAAAGHAPATGDSTAAHVL
jgi:hypothetical protein